MIYEEAKIKERWQEYCTELFCKENHVRVELEVEADEPEVLESEIEEAKKRLKKEKATGIDGTPAEALKAGGKTIGEGNEHHN